jgi:LysM repeat protein
MAEKVPVKKGDTLSGIAKAQGTTVAQILADNPTLAARQAAGQTVLFSGTKVLITDPKQATNPYAAATSGPAAGAGTNVGTASVPINEAAQALQRLTSGQTLSDADKKILGMGNTGVASSDTTGIIPDGGGDNPPDNPPTDKTVVSTVDNGDGTFTVTYSDGTTAITGTKKVEEAGTTAAEIQALLAQQAAEFQKQMAAMQAGITAQIEAANKASAAAAAQAKIDATNAQRKSAFEITKERFANAGMKELGDEITAIYQGTGVDRFGKKFDEIPTTGEGFYLALINTKSYYERFGKVNEDRLAKGFKALDERTIIGMEDEYQQVLQAYNQPAGFYDAPADYQVFLKNNYSKADVASALQASADFVASKDPVIRKELQTLFGIDDAALTAYYADPNKGQKILENIAGKNMNTAAALISGLSKEDATVGQQYGAGSFTYEQNRQRYTQAAQSLETTGNLARIYGENFGAKEAIAAEFGDAAAQAQAARVRQTGLAAFGGSSAVGTRALRTTGQVS